ncbi:MAG: 16S rRNA (uracil(1498)-N(3))-methyltransferase [Pseudomonadota bacterium]
MARYDYRIQRLFVDAPLEARSEIELSPTQSNYLRNVLRMPEGAKVLAFNGKDGEWQTSIVFKGKRQSVLRVVEQYRPQTPTNDLHYLFAPLKQARLDYMIQKAIEMGVGHLRPVLTEYTQNHRINLDKVQASAVEAAQQCGILSLPNISPPRKLTDLLDDWDENQSIIFCDESDEGDNPIAILEGLNQPPSAVLIGPEGGFSENERTLLRSKSFVVPIPLGPRILRADTAAVASLSLIQATRGDWV